MVSRVFLLGIFCLLCASSCQAIYLKMREGERRCFIQDTPKDTLVLTTFSSSIIPDPQRPDQNPNIDFGIRTTVLDPSGNTLYQKLSNSEGKVVFTTVVGGEHKLCFQTNTSKWFTMSRTIKFEFTVDTGAGATDYVEVAKLEHLNELQVFVRRLNDRVKEIRKEQAYMKFREMAARNTSESTNARVMWWSLIETILLIGSGLWQINYLKNFFKQKKLV